MLSSTTLSAGPDTPKLTSDQSSEEPVWRAHTVETADGGTGCFDSSSILPSLKAKSITPASRKPA